MQNNFKAIEWCSKSADLGSEKAQFIMGDCYEKGDGVERNLKRAKEWYAKAAKQGYKDAIQRLIELELKDDYIDIPRHKDDIFSDCPF